MIWPFLTIDRKMQTPIQIQIDARFPQMGATIFTVMLPMAPEYGALKLSKASRLEGWQRLRKAFVKPS